MADLHSPVDEFIYICTVRIYKKVWKLVTTEMKMHLRIPADQW